jgi:hypothetical protein
VKYLAIDAPLLWDSPPQDQVNVQNGLLDVNTRSLSPHSGDFLSPVQLPIKFDAAARCPAWDKFISEVFPADSEAIAWEIPAWLMTPDTSIQKAILLMGDGANGKSTYPHLYLIARRLGDWSGKLLKQVRANRVNCVNRVMWAKPLSHGNFCRSLETQSRPSAYIVSKPFARRAQSAPSERSPQIQLADPAYFVAITN